MLDQCTGGMILTDMFQNIAYRPKSTADTVEYNTFQAGVSLTECYRVTWYLLTREDCRKKLAMFN